MIVPRLLKTLSKKAFSGSASLLSERRRFAGVASPAASCFEATVLGLQLPPPDEAPTAAATESSGCRPTLSSTRSVGMCSTDDSVARNEDGAGLSDSSAI